MHFRLLPICFLTTVAMTAVDPPVVHAQEPVPRRLLSGGMSLSKLRQVLIPRDRFRPYPRCGDRARWLAIPEPVRRRHIQSGERWLGFAWPPLTATSFLDYTRTGNRDRYEDPRGARRKALADLTLAECFEKQGRFVDDIANGVWAISEESFWDVPAHVKQKAGPGLPDIAEPSTEIFSAETAALLAWVDYLVGDALDQVSPRLRERIWLETDRRILTPNLERDDDWMNTGMNHNSWVCSNWAAAILLLERDEERRARSVHKLLETLDNHLDRQWADGGIREGPKYWHVGAGGIFLALELLNGATKDTFAAAYRHPLLRNMGAYIYRAHLGKDYYFNYADTAPHQRVDGMLAFAFGQRLDDSLLTGFGAHLAREQDVAQRGPSGNLTRKLQGLWLLPKLARIKPRVPLPRDVWLPNIQMMVARDRADALDGFVVASRGGHNGESHNHNDVGQFIVYHDGRPIFVDPGVETYTARTFSTDRYSIWTMQSAYHNLPTINGHMQVQGRNHEAHAARHQAGARSAAMSLNIERAYPPAAGVRSWRRTVRLVRGQRVDVIDDYALAEENNAVALHFMTPHPPKLGDQGTILLGVNTGKGLALTYDADTFGVEVEIVSITDPSLRQQWNGDLHRITLTTRPRAREGRFQVSLAPAQPKRTVIVRSRWRNRVMSRNSS